MGLTIFLSWSGEGSASYKMASTLNGWLPSVIQSIEPYLSTHIEKGYRWSDSVAGKLATSGFGVLCITPASVNSPWILFEAGALSKMTQESRVAPIVYGMRKEDVRFPLSQFQMSYTQKDEILKLIKSINVCTDNPIDDGRMNIIFEKWWPDFEREISAISLDENEMKQSEVNIDQRIDRESEIVSRLAEISALINGLQQSFADGQHLNTDILRSVVQNEFERLEVRKRNRIGDRNVFEDESFILALGGHIYDVFAMFDRLTIASTIEQKIKIDIIEKSRNLDSIFYGAIKRLRDDILTELINNSRQKIKFLEVI